jgi:methyl-accepting chemotaxis protein
MKSMTIGAKIALGFAALLLITAILGGIAISDMLSVRKSARTLATEYVPEVAVAASMQVNLSDLQVQARTYGYTGNKEALAKAKAAFGKLRTDLEKAEKLARDFPTLVLLKTQVEQLKPALKAYEDAFNQTEKRTNEVEETRTKLDTAAGAFIQSIDTVNSSQRKRLTEEIAADATPTALADRLNKLVLAQEIRGLGNNVRILAFKAQALRETALLATTQAIFQTMDERFAILIGSLKDKTDITEANEAQQAAKNYRTALGDLAGDLKDLDDLGKARFTAAEKVQNIAEEIQATGMKRTVESAEGSNAELGATILLISIGVAVALALGIAVSWVIIWTITKVLKAVANSMNESAVQVTAAAGQVASASQSLAEGSTEQASSLEETSASLEEMSSMTRRNADSANQAKDLSNQTRAAADAGATHMEQMRDAMAAIKASSDDIAKIIKTIDEIAFQTNILALNAAVEAARAGEAGMGFAVVAEEVRNLAQRSAQSAKETAGKIEDAISKSEHGVVISAKVAEALADIVAKARRMDELVVEIATASNEQNQGIGQLNTAVSQMDKVTQSNASTAEESAAAAEELNAQAVAMQGSVADLRRLITRDAQASAHDGMAAYKPAVRHAPPAARAPAAAKARKAEPTASAPSRQPPLSFKSDHTPHVDSHDEHFSG